ncbi:MAG: hypothetical protein ACXWQR_05345 [Ktedonobacterales bacterium]
MRLPISSRVLLFCALTAVAVMLPGCASSATTSTSTPQTTLAPSPTPTPGPPCVADLPGSAPLSSISGVPGIQLPPDTYGTAGTQTGGAAGQYTVTTYTICFQGAEAAVDGGPMPPAGPPTSTVGHLVQAGWVLNNLFPDPTNFAYLDYCSTQHVCVNSTGTGSPFSFVGFDQYASQSGGYTTARLQVATITAPTCLNDAQYYSGTPKYTLYYDGNKATSSNPRNHFLMPPGTRVSTFLGGGTAGSVYVYFCSAGTQASTVDFLHQSMQNAGWTITNISSSGFSASTGTNPTYRIDVSISNPNNYYLRVFVPM